MFVLIDIPLARKSSSNARERETQSRNKSSNFAPQQQGDNLAKQSRQKSVSRWKYFGPFVFAKLATMKAKGRNPFRHLYTHCRSTGECQTDFQIAFFSPFVKYSRAIVSNEDLRPSTPWLDVWRHDFWGTPLDHAGSHQSWRPLCVLSYRLNYSWSGMIPFYFHLTRPERK